MCAGDPPAGPFSPFAAELHARWGLAGAAVAAARRAEDRRACEIVGAGWRHFDLPDCIYRRGSDGAPLYASREAIFGPLAAEEASRVEGLRTQLDAALQPGDVVYCPLSVGQHVDHQLTRRAAEQHGGPLNYYADLPYVLDSEAGLAGLLPPAVVPRCEPISAPALAAWAAAAAAYASQLHSFWADEAALQAALATYCAAHGGLRLWQPTG